MPKQFSRFAVKVLIVPLALCSASFANQTAYAQIQTPPSDKKEARKVDEFGDIYTSDLKARLDGFAITLQNEPESKGFMIVYRSHRDLPGLSGRLSNVVKSHLVNSRGIESQRIIAVDGGVSSCLKYELWVAPKGTAPKVKEPYLNSDFDNNVPTKFDSKPFYWMFEDDSDPTHFGDALEGFADALRKHKNFKAYIIVYGQHYLQEIDNSKYDANGNVIKKRVYKKLYQDSQAESGNRCAR